jgi:hypothetical protein
MVFTEIAQSLCNEFDWRFPSHELLDAFGIIYPQYWRQEGAEESFSQHLLVLKDFYSRAKVVNEGRPLVDGGKPYTAPKMLSASILDNQQGFFKLTIKANYEAACAPPPPPPPLTSIQLSSYGATSQSRGTCANLFLSTLSWLRLVVA